MFFEIRNCHTHLNKFEIPVSQSSSTVVIKLKQRISKQNILDVNTRPLHLAWLP